MNNKSTDPTFGRMIKELRLTQIICMISSLLTLCLLLGGILLYGKVQELKQVCEPAAEKLAAVDMESFNGALGNLNAALESADWDRVAEALGELDVESINSAIEGLDTEELTEGIKNLNDAVEKIREFSEMVSGLSSRLGGMFGAN